MHYVKYFDILGIDTAQVPCIELQGVPNTATEGAVGLFGMNMLSADHEIYVCIGVSGNIYTWIPLKGEGGITITSAMVNDVGELILMLSNGTTINAGVVVGKGCFVDGVPTDINFDSDPQTQIDARVKKSGDTVTGALEVQGALRLPNSPTTPEKSEPVTHRFASRQTANASVTGLTVVDGSLTDVMKIQGDTVTCKNLIPLPYMYGTSYTSNGITYTVDKYGVITANGTSSPGVNSVFMMEKNRVVFDGTKKLTISGCSGGSDSTYRFVFQLYKGSTFIREFGKGDGAATIDLSTLDFDNHQFYILVRGGVTLNNVKFYPMVEYGDTASEFQPYFTGLKSAYIGSIKSTGRNIFNQKDLISNSDFTLTTYQTGECYKLVPTAVEHRFPLFIPKGETVCIGLLMAHPNTGSDIHFRAYFADGTFTSIASKVNGNTTESNLTELKGKLTLGKDMVAFSFDTYGGSAFQPYYLKDIIINTGLDYLDYEPYKESVYKLPAHVELGKWDYIDVVNKKIYRYTQTRVFSGGDGEDWSSTSDGVISIWVKDSEWYADVIHNYTSGVCVIEGTRIVFKGGDAEAYDGDITAWREYLAERYRAGNPITTSYLLATPIIEDIDIPNKYAVWDGGREMIVQGDIDHSIYGATHTITQTYNIHENPTEAATKAYVKNGLVKKLDKTGGTITGSLVVEGKTDTVLGAIVSKQGTTTYGLTYDGDAYKLGKGKVDDNGNFTFDDGEGLPVSLREDSNKFADGELVMWSTQGNKFVSTGITLATLKAKLGI